MGKEIEIQGFLHSLNQKPEKVFKHEYGGFEYLPISFVEKALDELFLGLWEIEIKSTEVVLNSIVVEVRLSVLHPITGQKINRSGVGAKAIQLKQGSAVGDLTKIQSNALELGYPAAKANAFKNAAQSLGKIFGRDIIREVEKTATYEGNIDLPADENKLEELKEKYLQSVHHLKVIDAISLEGKQTLSKQQQENLLVFMRKNYKKPGAV